MKTSKSVRAGVQMPVSNLQQRLKHSTRRRVSPTAAVYLAAALDYMVGEVVELAGNLAHGDNRRRIAPKHINTAIQADSELSKMQRGVIIPGVDKGVELAEAEVKRQNLKAEKRMKKQQH